MEIKIFCINRPLSEIKRPETDLYQFEKNYLILFKIEFQVK